MKAIPKHPMFDTDKAKALRDCMQCSRGMIGNGPETASCKLRLFFAENFGDFCASSWKHCHW